MQDLDEIKRHLHYDPATGAITYKGKTFDTAAPSTGYVHVAAGGRLRRAHRLAFLYMEGILPEEEVDHINGNRADNRWSNLRKVTKAENSRNQGLAKNNTSGYVGVTWSEHNQKWRATIKVDYKRMHLGYFRYKFDALSARLEAERKFGFHPNHGKREAYA